MFHHLTYEIDMADLHEEGLEEMLRILGFREVEPGEPAPWPLRWFKDVNHTTLHLVGRDTVPLGLGHFCATVPRHVWDGLRRREWCTRDSGSGRIWLEAYGLRVEVRPYAD
jgi:hypothetical protein